MVRQRELASLVLRWSAAEFPLMPSQSSTHLAGISPAQWLPHRCSCQYPAFRAYAFRRARACALAPATK